MSYTEVFTDFICELLGRIDVAKNLCYIISMTLEELKYKTKPVFDKYRIKYAGVFGSFARGEEKKDSDMDIMIDYHRPFSLLDLIGLENALKDLLQKKVDIVTENGASKYMKSGMLKDLKVFYGQR